MTMENQEEVLDALNSFEKKPSTDIPPLLEQYLRQVAKTGETLFPWQNLRALFINKLDQVMKQFRDLSSDQQPNCPNVENTRFDDMRSRILQTVEQFQGAPFTIQRLCELLTDPRRHYKRSDKFLRGIEKNVLVVSTVDPFGRKVVSETRAMVNGLDLNGFSGGQGDGQPTPFSAFPTSPLPSLSFDKNAAVKISVECDEMPEAENEKILKDIMETEKSQTLQDSLQDDTTEPFSTELSETGDGVESENKPCEMEQDSLKDTKNNVNSYMQNADTTEDKQSNCDNEIDTGDNTSEGEELCDTTATSGVKETTAIQGNENTAIQGKEAEAEKENILGTTHIGNTSQKDSTVKVKEDYISTANETTAKIGKNVINSDVSSSFNVTSDTQEIQNLTSDKENDIQTTQITSSEDRLVSAEHQTPLPGTKTDSTENSDIQTVTESDKTCDSSNDIYSDSPCNTSSDVNDTEHIQSIVTSVGDIQEKLTPVEEIHQSKVTSTVTDQSDNMDVDSSCVTNKCEENVESSKSADSQTKDESVCEETDSSEVPMEQD